MEDKLEETKYHKIVVTLIKFHLGLTLAVIAILIAIIMYFGSELSKILLIFLLVLLTISVILLISMLIPAIKEIKVKNEQTTPSIPKVFEKIPKDVIFENYEELTDIENLNGDLNYTSKLKLASLSNKKIKHWIHFAKSSNLQKNPINLKAYLIGNNGEVIRDHLLDVESIREGINSQIFLINLSSFKTSEIEFMIEFPINRIFPAMLTTGEYITTTFPRQVKKYKFEIRLPEGVQKIERFCITKKMRDGGIIENVCYSVDGEEHVPIQEICYPHNQLGKEIRIVKEEGRYKIVLKSESGLNADDSVKIWWLCS